MATAWLSVTKLPTCPHIEMEEVGNFAKVKLLTQEAVLAETGG